MGGIRGAMVAAAAAALLCAAPATAAVPSSLTDACQLRDGADGNTANGSPLSFYLCDDGTPAQGGESANETGAKAIEVPAAYGGFQGLPAKDATAAAAVPGADSEGNVAIDANLTFPDPARFAPPAGGYPLVVFMHGCCGGSKVDWQADTIDGGTSAEKWHHSNAWFAARGYAVLTYTARGFVNSNEEGSTGQTQLDHRSFEINDYQHLAGQLADGSFTVAGQTVKVDGGRVVTIGGSYGGGFSWMALTDPTWKSPGGKDMRLVASTPKYGWTDLVYSLVPNGAHLEDRLQATDGADTRTPVGRPKQSIVAGLYASGKTGVPPGTAPHTTFTSEIDESIVCLQAPLPLEANPACAGPLNNTLPSFIQNRSAYYQNGFFDGLRDGSVQPVPLYSAGTLTDPLFPGREHRRMTERLRAVKPDYPVKEYYGDYQHFVQNKRKEWSDLCGTDRHVCTLADYPGGDLNATPPTLARSGPNDDLSDFVDHYAKPQANASEGTPSFDVTSSLQICPSNASERFRPDEPGERFTAKTFDELAPNKLVIRHTQSATTTSVAAPNQHARVADPVANQVANGSRCPLAPGPAGPGVASYDAPALERSYTMIGPTRVTVPYTSTGSELQLNARLYDVGPDGSAVMVDRGFRILGASSGSAVIDLIGNGWRFERGHTIRVELAQDDAPFIKPSVAPSTMSLNGATLEIPVREATATAEAPPVADARPSAPDDDEPRDTGDDDDARRPRVVAAGSGSLPFTGLDVRPFFALGAALALAGVLARRRLA